MGESVKCETVGVESDRDNSPTVGESRVDCVKELDDRVRVDDLVATPESLLAMESCDEGIEESLCRYSVEA
jgi:hypothetical protein